MAEGYRSMRTEHSGGKNGGGFHGKRNEAKRASKVRRRERERKLENQQYEVPEDRERGTIQRERFGP